jgi:O-antigen/teichoic acid export membrane protein
MKLNLNWLWSRLKDGHLEELVRGSLGFFNLRLVGTAFTYVFVYLVTHRYGAEVLGVFSLSIAALRISSLYGRMGLDNALVRFIAEYAARGRKDFVKQVYLRGVGAAIPSSLGISLLLYFAAPFLADNVFHNPALTTTLRIIAVVTFPDTLLHINAAVLRGLKRTASYAFLIHAAQFLLGSLVLFFGRSLLAENSAPVVAFAGATLAAALISFGFGVVPRRLAPPAISKPGETGPGNGNNGKVPPETAIPTRGLMKVAFPMLLTGSYSFLLKWIGILILGFYRSETEVGIFDVAVRIAALLTFTLTSINSIAAAKFSECYSSGDMEGFQKVVKYATRLIFWTTVPIGAAIVAFPTAISGFFGEELKGGATALVILVVGEFTNAISGPVGNILNMTGYQMVFQKIVLSAAVLSIILNILLIPHFGIEGSAVANTVGMCFWNIASVIYVKRKFNVLTLYIPYLTQRRKSS